MKKFIELFFKEEGGGANFKIRSTKSIISNINVQISLDKLYLKKVLTKIKY